MQSPRSGEILTSTKHQRDAVPLPALAIGIACFSCGADMPFLQEIEVPLTVTA